MKHEGKNKKRVRNGGENMKFEAMFQPIQIGPMTVANRFVMSPMGNNPESPACMMTAQSAAFRQPSRLVTRQARRFPSSCSTQAPKAIQKSQATL